MRMPRGPCLPTLVSTFVLALLACGGSEGSDGSPVYRAPAEARAAWVLEPPVVAVGDVATLELAVIAAPGTALAPFELPDRVKGFYVLDREPVQVSKEPARWVHETRLRVRAIEVGRFEVPGGHVELESAEGGTTRLAYEPLPVEVVSVLAGTDRQTPYGIRLLDARRDGAGSLAAFAAGAVLTLLGVGLLLLVRRRLAEAPEPLSSPPSEGPPAWELARTDLSVAREVARDDPREALDRASRSLRRYAARRFGGDAPFRTTEELALAQPPFTLTTRWSHFLALLGALDAARFAPPTADADADAERTDALLDDALAFVEETTPPEAAA